MFRIAFWQRQLVRGLMVLVVLQAVSVVSWDSPVV